MLLAALFVIFEAPLNARGRGGGGRRSGGGGGRRSSGARRSGGSRSRSGGRRSGGRRSGSRRSGRHGRRGRHGRGSGRHGRHGRGYRRSHHFRRWGGCFWYAGLGYWLWPAWGCHWYPGLGYWSFPWVAAAGLWPTWWFPGFGFSLYLASDYPGCVVVRDAEASDFYCAVYYQDEDAGRLVRYIDPRIIADAQVKVYVPVRRDKRKRILVISKNENELIDQLPTDPGNREDLRYIILKDSGESNQENDAVMRFESLSDEDQEYVKKTDAAIQKKAKKKGSSKGSKNYKDTLREVSLDMNKVDPNESKDKE
jgi:hypothetical protein